MSISQLNGSRAAGAAGQGACSPYAAFVAEIADLARSVDPALASLLTGEASSAPTRRWSGGERRGLELCLRMLTYARDEVARGDEGVRIDHCIRHVTARLAELD